MAKKKAVEYYLMHKDIDKAEMDFSIYGKDLLERHIRIPKLQELYEKKRMTLKAFQDGKDVWKNARY